MFCRPVALKGGKMTEILKQIGVSDASVVLSFILSFIGICAFLVAMVTEALKSVKKINALPTRLVCYVVALVLTTPVFLAMMQFMRQPVEWYMVFASFLASFVVAKVAMGGWDDVTDIAKKLLRM